MPLYEDVGFSLVVIWERVRAGPFLSRLLFLGVATKALFFESIFFGVSELDSLGGLLGSASLTIAAGKDLATEVGGSGDSYTMPERVSGI